ncbi:MAG: hypothetical protein AAFP83_02735 [Bacteroidota bacterium]
MKIGINGDSTYREAPTGRGRWQRFDIWKNTHEPLTLADIYLFSQTYAN